MPGERERKLYPRQCGGCTACCREMRIEALDNPAFEKCPNQVQGGCGIYETRPDECRTWHCAWVRDDQFLSDRDRPDKGGMMFYWLPQVRLPNGAVIKGTDVQLLKCQETIPGAFNSQRNLSLIERLTKKGIVVIKNKYMEKDGPVEVEICVPTHDKYRQLYDHVSGLIKGSGVTPAVVFE